MKNSNHCKYRIKVFVQGGDETFIPQVKRAWWWIFWENLYHDQHEDFCPPCYRGRGVFGSDLAAYEVIFRDIHYIHYVEEKDYDYCITDFGDLMERHEAIRAAQEHNKQ